MTGKIPKAGLSREAAIDQHVEAIDSEECCIPLTARKYVEGGVWKANVSHNIGAFEKRLNVGGHEKRGEVIEEVIDGWAARREDIVGVHLNFAVFCEGLFWQSRPIAFRRAVDIYGYRVLVRSDHPLDFILLKGLGEIGQRERSVLKKTPGNHLFYLDKWTPVWLSNDYHCRIINLFLLCVSDLLLFQFQIKPLKEINCSGAIMHSLHRNIQTKLYFFLF